MQKTNNKKFQPLRKCRKCGLEAWNETDLEKFTKLKSLPYGRRTLCKTCGNAYVYFQREGHPKIISQYLRICVICGKKALDKNDLSEFALCKRSKYGRKNRCKKCHSDIRHKYYLEHSELINNRRHKSHLERRGNIWCTQEHLDYRKMSCYDYILL